MMRTKYLVVLSAGVVMACASASTGGVPGTGHSTNVITRDEILDAHVYNAWDAIQRLRPSYLRSHGSSTLASSDAGYPSVYMNRQLYGDIGSLKQIEIASIQEIHYYTPAEAATRYGVGVPNGVIEVITGSQ